MSVQPSPAGSDPVSNFCAHVITTFAAKWPVDENTIASEFVTFFGAQDCNLYPQLVDLCLRLSVEVHLADLPPENSGINVCYRDRRAIFVRKAELSGLTREHTLLHELREIIEYKFRELGRPLARKNDLEERAEAFAVFVRMECASEMWSTVFKSVGNLQVRWQRIGAYILVAAGVIVHFFWAAIPSLNYLVSSDKAHKIHQEQQRQLRSVPVDSQAT